MNQSKRLSLGAIFVAVIAVSFLLGLREGSVTAPAESLITSIANKDQNKPVAVDFSPFWKAWSVINQKFAGTTTSDQDKVYGAIQGMVSSLGDPYTVFFSPNEDKIFQSEIAGNFEGVGMEVGIKDGRLAVVAPIKGSPADKAGVKSGDYILDIDGTDSSTITTDAAVNLIRGKAGTTVKLTLGRTGVKNPIDISIVRAVINLPTVDTTMKDEVGSTTASSTTNADTIQKNGIYVISLYSFSENSADLFRNALKGFVDSGDHKLIIDLRGNPGGYLDAAVDMASWFLPSGKVVVREDFGNNQPETVYRSKGYNIFNNNLQMMILVDNGSASAAEILAGALKLFRYLVPRPLVQTWAQEPL